VSQISSIANVLTYAESAEQAEELLSSQYQVEPAAVFFIYYDDTYQLCSADKASYTITVTPVDTENRIYTWTIKMYGSDAGAISLSDASADSEDSIYELQVEVYYAE
jgi:hypothetical protein